MITVQADPECSITARNEACGLRQAGLGFPHYLLTAEHKPQQTADFGVDQRANPPSRSALMYGSPSRCWFCLNSHPHTEHGDLSYKDQEKLPDAVFAFPKERKEPLTDASHVRNALDRFDQVKGVTDQERDQAWANILAAAKHYGLHVEEKDWRELGKRPHTTNPGHEHASQR